jgi:L-seryl-tRNA(Ser) seleniumtransferase
LFARVINATGVVLHTNLGRAPLGQSALDAIAAISGGYNNLEYTVETGERGSRHIHGETMLNLLTGAEAAMVVNNGAEAILLALSAMAAGKEVVLSRGEMIEIGGSFRVPDIMTQSGCQLVEVGTTNRTHLEDYQKAINPQTGAILKVHTSNYRISGFTAAVSNRELAVLAHNHDIPLVEDLGSGVLIDTAKHGLMHEPTVQEALAAGVDLVTCSGDKLLGGPQAGLILGRADLVARCKRHPLARALRVGKLTLAALQATLTHYLQGEEDKEVPIWRMCSLSSESIGSRAAAMAYSLGSLSLPVAIEVMAGKSAVGGGSLPGETLPTMLLAIRGEGSLSPQSLAKRLRQNVPPVVARVEANSLLLDLRTVAPDEDALALSALQKALVQEDAACT